MPSHTSPPTSPVGNESDMEDTYAEFYRHHVPGAMTLTEDDESKNDYAWLDVIDEDNCYMPLELSNSRPSKSLDFGKDGFTGSLSTWHELLQITAPDPRCGLVFVRGDFPDHPDSILARAQRRNQKGTFGMSIRIPEKADWVQEATPAQGMINLRWPFTRLHWTHTDKKLGANHIASFTECSFVKDGTVYQIARVVPRQLTKSTPSSSMESLASGDNIKFTVDVGGVIRFGCPTTAANRVCDENSCPTTVPPTFHDTYTCIPDGGTSYLFACTSEVHEKRLEMRLWVDRKPQELPFHDCKSSRLQHGPRPEGPHEKEACPFHVRKDLDFQQNKATVIVASFRLVDSSDPPSRGPTKVIAYEEVQRYLGVLDYAPLASYRLWCTVIGHTSLGADTSELNAMGRSVETILGVSSLPVSIHCHDPGKGSREESHGLRQAVALIKNIITPQVVDIESAFWQVRLLVKAAELLTLEPNWSSSNKRLPDKQRDQFHRMQHRYRRNLVHLIKSVCLWVLQIARPTGNPNELQDRELGILASDVLHSGTLAPDVSLNEEAQATRKCCKATHSQKRASPIGDQKYYCAILLWYVFHHLPEILDQFTDTSGPLWKYFVNLAFILAPDRSGIVAIDDPAGCIVRWYHNLAFFKICDSLQRSDERRFLRTCTTFREHIEMRIEARQRERVSDDNAGDDGMERLRKEDDFNLVGVDANRLLHQALKWQTKAEKAMRLFEQGRLSGRNLGHEAANLAHLAPELGIENTAITLRGKSCYDYAKDLVGRRCPTDHLNAGRSRILRWDPQHDIRSAKPRPAPWELSCLAQQLPQNLNVFTAGDSRGACFDRCKEFMFTDYTFMGSWDASKATTIGQWWDFSTSSIVSAKLLEEQFNSRKGMDGIQETRNGETKCNPDQDEGVSEEVKLLREICAYHEENRKRLSGTGFEWIKRKPRMLYHSDANARSLEDTPEVYKIKQQSDVDLRHNIREYFRLNYMPPAEYSLETVKDSVGPSKVHNLSCFDIVLTTDRNDLPEISEPIASGRANNDFFNNWVKQKSTHRRNKLMKLLGSTKGLMDLYLIGKAEEHLVYQSEDEAREILDDVVMRSDLLYNYQDELFTVLNDSMVDRGVKYRLIFAKHLSPATLQAMVYMWHPDAIDTFDDYLGDLSNFSESTSQSLTGSEDTLITSITIKHWRLLGDDESKIREAEKKVDDDENKHRKEQAQARAKEKDKQHQAEEVIGGKTTMSSQLYDFKFPPRNVQDDRPTRATLWKQNASASLHLSRIHELGLSLVISGDERGNSWTCTIICELFGEEDVIRYSSEVSHTLQMFIHQQYTGRTLVFLLLLGYMCEKLAVECDIFMNELDGIMKLNPTVLLDGMEWEKSDQALRRLKQMLWGFEALRHFGDKLAKALEVVDDAGKKMKAKLDEGASIRHKDMVHGVEQVKEEFEKRRTRLANAHSSLKQRVDQGIKLREGISSVLSVEQNENISMLTWLTIIYLGPALLAGIFGAGHGLVPDNQGLEDFYVYLAYLVVGTVVFALLLRYIIEAVRIIVNFVLNPLRKRVLQPGKEDFQVLWAKIWLRLKGCWDEVKSIARHGRNRGRRAEGSAVGDIHVASYEAGGR